MTTAQQSIVSAAAPPRTPAPSVEDVMTPRHLVAHAGALARVVTRTLDKASAALEAQKDVALLEDLELHVALMVRDLEVMRTVIGDRHRQALAESMRVRECVGA
jgi:hypothetical protein